MGASRLPFKGVACRLGSSIIKTASPKKSVTGLGLVGFRVHGAGFTAFHDASAKRAQNCFLSSLVQLDENCHGQPSTLSACNRFSIVEKRCWDCARGLAQPARVCQQIMVRQRRLFAYLAYPVILRLARMLAWLVDVTDFRPSRNGDGAEPVASHSLRECRGAMVRRRRLYAYLAYPVAPMHVGVGRIEKR